MDSLVGSTDTIVLVTQMYDHPSPAAALLQLARIKSGLSQTQLADRAGVPATMISAYERDRRQPTLPTLLRLLEAAGFDLRMELVPHDPHDEILAELESKRTRRERTRRDRQQAAWRRAVPVADHQPVKS
jgi:transcriptional regulator with XRE-family HTH domain